MLQTVEELLNHRNVQQVTPDLSSLNIGLRRTREKGVGIYALKPIQKGEVIALYRLQVFRSATYQSPTQNKYCFAIYTRSGNESKAFLGDLVPESLQPPRKMEDGVVPYWAYFSNEPSSHQSSNAYVDINGEENYATRKRLKEGDYVVYKLRARRTIDVGEEVVWHYGTSYHDRGYIVASSAKK